MRAKCRQSVCMNHYDNDNNRSGHVDKRQNRHHEAGIGVAPLYHFIFSICRMGLALTGARLDWSKFVCGDQGWCTVLRLVGRREAEAGMAQGEVSALLGFSRRALVVRLN